MNKEHRVERKAQNKFFMSSYNGSEYFYEEYEISPH